MIDNAYQAVNLEDEWKIGMSPLGYFRGLSGLFGFLTGDAINAHTKVDIQETVNKDIELRNSCAVERYKGNSKRVLIPNYVNNKRITIVADHIFMESKMISWDEDEWIKTSEPREIIVSEGILYIGDEAFIDMDSIKSITFPSTVKMIGERCLSGTSIEELELPSHILYLLDGCCCNCLKLRKVIFPEKLEHIGNMAFQHCTSLKHIHLPKNLKTIGYMAFYGTGLTNVAIPDGVEVISNAAFGTSTLRTCSIPSSVIAIDDEAFSITTQREDGKWETINNPNLTLYVYPGSYALMWAREHGYKVASAEI